MALLVLLATDSKGTVGREKLIGYLWPDVATERARHLLSEAVYQLRKAIGADLLTSEGGALRLDPSRVSCDTTDFETLAESGEHEAALALYGGAFLDGFNVRNAPDFERWAETERQRLSDLAGECREALANGLEDQKRFVEAARHWKLLIAHDPYNSRYVARRMWALAASGDPANAVQEAEEHTRFLREELDAEPPEDLRALADWLRDDPPRAEVVRARDHRASPPEEHRAPAHPRSCARRRRTVIAVLSGATLLVASAAALRVMDRAVPEAAPEFEGLDLTRRVAVLPFDYQGSEEYAYLGASLASMLSTMLDGIGDVRAVHPAAVEVVASRSNLTDAGGDKQRAISEQLVAGRYVTGEMLELDGRLRIDARLHSWDEESGLARVASVEGEADAFFDLLDGLGRQLLLELVGTDREYHGVAAQTTDSLSALKAYLDGVAKRRRFAFDSAVVSFRRAAEIDSTFALAWFGMGIAAAWPIPEWEAGVEASRRAVRHSAALPVRVQKTLRAYSAAMQGDGLEAERLSREVLADYPDDVQAWWTLAWSGSFYPFYGRPMSDVRAPALRAYELDPHDPDHRAGAAWWAVADGNWARLDSLWGPSSFPTRAIRTFGSGDEAAQERILSEAPAAEGFEVSLAASWLAGTRGDIQAAASLSRLRNIDSLSHEARALGVHVSVGMYEVALGRWRAAWKQLVGTADFKPMWADLYRTLWGTIPYAPLSRQELEDLRERVRGRDVGAMHPSVTSTRAWAHDILAPQLRLYTLGRLSLRLGDLDEALRYADELEALGNPDEALSFAVDRAHSLRAHVWFQRGRLEGAIAALEAQPRRIRIQWLYDAPFYSSPEDRYLRGEIYSALERYDEAVRWYATVNTITWHDSPYLAISHLRRAEIYDRLGETEKAVEHYGTFVHLWRDCDPELQHAVDEARRALRRLAG